MRSLPLHSRKCLSPRRNRSMLLSLLRSLLPHSSHLFSSLLHSLLSRSPRSRSHSSLLRSLLHSLLPHSSRSHSSLPQLSLRSSRLLPRRRPIRRSLS